MYRNILAMDAHKIFALDDLVVFSYSDRSLLKSLNHEKVRSTTHRTGMGLKIFFMSLISDRLNIFNNRSVFNKHQFWMSPLYPESPMNAWIEGNFSTTETRSFLHPFESWISAEWTSTSKTLPQESVTITRLRPQIFLPPSNPMDSGIAGPLFDRFSPSEHQSHLPLVHVLVLTFPWIEIPKSYWYAPESHCLSTVHIDCEISSNGQSLWGLLATDILRGWNIISHWFYYVNLRLTPWGLAVSFWKMGTVSWIDRLLNHSDSTCRKPCCPPLYITKLLGKHS